MGRILLVCRLAARDLRRHRAQAALLLLAITAAAATLTLGLALHGVTSQPYQQTRAATNGPDVVAYLPVIHQPGHRPGPPAQATALTRAPGVTGHSGPYPLASAILRVHGITAGVEAEGCAPAAWSSSGPSPRRSAPAPAPGSPWTAGRSRLPGSRSPPPTRPTRTCAMPAAAAATATSAGNSRAGTSA